MNAAQSRLWPRPTEDEDYTVQVSNLLVDGVPLEFSCVVTVMDPAVSGPDTILPTISGPDSVVAYRPQTYSFDPVPTATGYQWRATRRALLTDVEGAESGTGNFDVETSPGYSIIVNSPVATGNGAFHLAHSTSVNQYLTDARELAVVESDAELQFASRLGVATSDQVARVQISLDRTNWEDVYVQAGDGQPGETSFQTRTIPLGSYVDRIIAIRFAYTFRDGFFFAQTLSGIGWYIDDIEYSGVEELTDSVDTDLPSGTSFDFTAEGGGEYALVARAEVYDEFLLDWGIVRRVTAIELPPLDVSLTDPNDDGLPDITDAVALLEYLFLAAPLRCPNEGNVNGDTELDIIDVLYLLQCQFGDGVCPPVGCSTVPLHEVLFPCQPSQHCP